MHIELYWMRLPLLTMALVVGFGGWPTAGNAQERPWSEKPVFGEDEGEEWKELGFELPAFPVEDGLHLLDLEYVDTRYNFYIDRNSLSVGKDRILRYTAVVESASGGRNVFYEGVRCDTGEFKTYAFGTRRGTFKPYRNPRWKRWDRLPRKGPQGFRQSLLEDYLCDMTAYLQSTEAVLKRLGSSSTRDHAAAFPSANDERVLSR